jgi:hypothetical protein
LFCENIAQFPGKIAQFFVKMIQNTRIFALFSRKTIAFPRKTRAFRRKTFAFFHFFAQFRRARAFFLIAFGSKQFERLKMSDEEKRNAQQMCKNLNGKDCGGQ